MIVALRADDIAAYAALATGLNATEAFTVLNKQEQLNRFSFWDNRDWAWYKQRIPFLETPDTDIDETYYYRWELLTKHMVYANPDLGYCFSEFINRPNGYGAISCALGHHIDDLRWLKDRRITDDYINYWYDNPSSGPRSYSNWYNSAVWGYYLANADKPFLIGRIPSMEQQYQGWMDEHWDAQHRMFHWAGMHDGMEINIESRQTQHDFDGADNYRPTLNSYVYGDLNALANAEELDGNSLKAADYRNMARMLKQRVQQELWDPKRQFFMSQFGHDEENNGYTIKAQTLIYQDGKYAGDPHGRELTGYIPWMFELPDKDKGYEAAWKGMTDPEVFLASYGFYFAERHDPLFLVAQGGCVWSGNNWPYADAQVLTAMANVLNNYPQNVITSADYFRALQSYTRCQRKNGKPYIAECGDPDTGRWTQDSPGSSDDYNHSSYIDLIITGLLGLRPRADNVVEVNPLAPTSWKYFALDDVAYHGHRLSLLWDRDGTRYGRGKGLRIIVDGKTIASSPNLGRLTAILPSVADQAPVDRPVNFAANNDGNYFPKIRTTYTAPGTGAGFLVDGTYFYNQGHPTNRWTTEGTTHSTDMIDIDFGAQRPLNVVKLYLLDDGPGQPVRTPSSYALEYLSDSGWKPIPGQVRTPQIPEGHRPNIIEFPMLSTSRIRVVLTPKSGQAVGATEIEAWGHAALPLSHTHLPPSDLALQATASASYTWREDSAVAVNDGVISMNGGPRNRWTAYQTTNPSDWIELDFPSSITTSRMEICFWADGGGVRLPKNYSIQYWDGDAWRDVQEISRNPEAPAALSSNEIVINQLTTKRLRLTLVNDPAGGAGVTEWLVWPN